MMPYFWQPAINPKLKTQNLIIFFGYVDFHAKIFLILYTPFENSITRIAILPIANARTQYSELKTNPSMSLYLDSHLIRHIYSCNFIRKLPT